jgi:hypothetical protein
MKRLSFLIILLSLLGCNTQEKDMLHSLKNDKLVSVTYEEFGKLYKCNPALAQPKLLTWLLSMSEPPIASWADPDHYLTLEFQNGPSFRARVTFGGQQNLNYSTIRLPNLLIGKTFDFQSICT